MTASACGGSVAWLSIAPVKALGLVHPEAIDLGLDGVSADRRFLLVDADGRLFNGKRGGSLVQIRPEYDEARERLTLTFPDGGEVTGETGGGAPFTAGLYGERLETRLVEGALAAALSEFAGEPLRLLRVVEPASAVDRGRQGAATLLSVAALAALATHAGAGDRVDARRFRMLVGVDGVEAHAEDAWIGRRVQVGEAIVVPREPVGRCAVTTQNPDTGVPDLDTLRVIGGYRADVPTVEAIPFGVWGSVEQPGRVALGDPVRLLG